MHAARRALAKSQVETDLRKARQFNNEIRVRKSQYFKGMVRSLKEVTSVRQQEQEKESSQILRSEDSRKKMVPVGFKQR